MKDVKNVKQGQTLTLSRKSLKGDFENIPVTFIRSIPSDSKRCWIQDVEKREFRVAISKLTLEGEKVPAHVQYGAGGAPESGDSSKKENSAKEEIENISSSKKVDTSIKNKGAKKVEAKKVVDTTKSSKTPSKTDRALVLIAKGVDLNEIISTVGCSPNIVKEWARCFRLLDENNMSSKDVAKIMRRSEETLLIKYNEYVRIKNK